MDTKKSGPLLSVQDLTVGFARRDGSIFEAVKGLSFDIEPGQATAIVGESGSGKTVSMRAMLRLLPQTAKVGGQAKFEGADLISMPTPKLRKLRGRSISMVFQNAMEAMNPTVPLKRQLTEHLLWHGICDRKEANRRAIEALGGVGIPEPERRIKMYPFQLSGGMRQRAMIAMAMVSQPSLLIADEPTTAVDVTIQRQILDLLAELKDNGLAIIMITHDLGVARHFCDDVVVMNKGIAVEKAPTLDFVTNPRDDYSKHLLNAAMDVGDTEHLSAEPTLLRKETTKTSTGLLVEVSDISKVFDGRGGSLRAVDDVSVTIGRGETIGVVGESGSGKSTLARLIMRLIEPTDGDVRYGGDDLLAAHGEKLRLLRKRMQMVFQNPYGSLLPNYTVNDNVSEPLKIHKIGDKKSRRDKAAELLRLVGIPPERGDQYPRQFSGGQQQRVAIARALALEPELLVCDEPTSALDVSIQAQILNLLRELQDKLGFAMLFITHNLAVAENLSDRIIVMSQGRIVESAATAAIFTAPQHPYTQTLLAAVLPVRGAAPPAPEVPWDGTTTGELVETAPGHYVRLSNPITKAS